MEQSNMVEQKNIAWHSPMEPPFRIAGFAWFAEERRYRRLPTAPKWKLPEAVDILADHTAGGQIQFVTNSSSLHLSVRLKGKADMYHMPPTGQCGFDCYIGPPGNKKYCATAQFKPWDQEYESKLFENYSREPRLITLNFPLYQGVEEVKVGLDHDAWVESPPAYDSTKKVVLYGTSITQGACASRPGINYSNILSRRINMEFINLGFSGSGKGEPEVARVISEIADPACLVLDYEANCVSTEQFRKTLPEFIQIFREAHPDVPILVVSRIPYAMDAHDPESARTAAERKELQRETVEARRAAGDNRIHFVDGSSYMTLEPQEISVDGIHPTDLGLMQIADGLTPIIRNLIKGS